MKKLTKKDIGKTVTIREVSQNDNETREYTGTYLGQVAGRRPGWFSIDGRQFNSRNCERIA